MLFRSQQHIAKLEGQARQTTTNTDEVTVVLEDDDEEDDIDLENTSAVGVPRKF